ncbi:DUF2283 domain-containing protein [Candidatus Pacearchaeota archaeon]|nr:DUF2283 domain-containing protein [Candidatus Pacearchaeota archaeon]
MEGEMRIYYDEEGDYLTIFIGESKPNYGEEIDDDITIFRDQISNEVVGIGVLNFKERAKSLKDIELKLPFKVNFSALKI